jgi:hypothetical protein
MPATPHDIFTPPDDPDAKIWRYMDFTKYVSLLDSQALFFCRADRIGDPFEGTLSHGTHKAWLQLIESEKLPADLPHKIFKIARAFRRWTFLNCWHIGDYESAAMWKLYAKSDEAIAVQSTYSSLCRVVPERVHVGIVRYIDYDLDEVPSGNSMWPFLFKRKSFEHERELRAVIQEPPLRDSSIDLDLEPSSEGIFIPVILDGFIQATYVAPFTPDWYFELVTNVTKRFGLQAPVRRSKLQDGPVI